MSEGRTLVTENFLWGEYQRYYMKGFIRCFVVSFYFLKESFVSEILEFLGYFC